MLQADNLHSRLRLYFPALLILITVLAYAQTITFPFLELDDVPLIVQNSYAHSWSSLPSFFFPAQADSAVKNEIKMLVPSLYRPVDACWVLLNYKLFRLHPSFWHLALVLLYVIGVWLMWRVAWELTREDFVAGLAAFLYALHPLHVESVAWISGVVDPLVSAFFLAGFLAYLRWRRDPRLRWAVACAGLTFLALLSKETAAALPVLIVGHFLIFRRNEAETAGIGHFQWLIGCITTSVVAYAALRFAAIHSVVVSRPEHGWGDVLRTAPLLFVTYVQHALWPVALAGWYDTSVVPAFVSSSFLLPLAFCIAYSAFTVWAIVRKPLLGFLLLWWAVSLIVPIVGVLSFHDFGLVHDRFAFLGLASLCLILALAVQKLPSVDRFLFGYNAPAVMVAAVFVSVLGVLAAVQVNTWRNGMAVYAQAVEVSPRSIRPRILLSQELLHERYFDNALALARDTEQMAPERWDAAFSYGMTLAATGHRTEAIRMMVRGSQLAPTQTAVYFGWAKILADAGDFAEAAEVLQHGISIAEYPEVLRSRLADLPAAEKRWEEGHRTATQSAANN